MRSVIKWTSRCISIELSRDCCTRWSRMSSLATISTGCVYILVSAISQSWRHWEISVLNNTGPMTAQFKVESKCHGVSTEMYHSGNLIFISTNISNIYKQNVYCFCYWVGPDKKPTNCIFHGTNIWKPISILYLVLNILLMCFFGAFHSLSS